jgi:hypothetical protein
MKHGLKKEDKGEVSGIGCWISLELLSHVFSVD